MEEAMGVHAARVMFCRGVALLVAVAAMAGAWVAIVSAPRPVRAAEGDGAQKLRVYAGTYTTAKSKGIYLLELDLKTGELLPKGLAATSGSPSFLAIHPNRQFLYAVNEVDTGTVSAFAIDAQTGLLAFLNKQRTRGAHPTHLVVDRQGKNVLAANYTGGSVAVLPIAADGQLGAATGFIQHSGKSVDRSRQTAPHAHGIALDSPGRFAYVADLGLDKVLIYRLDPAAGTIVPNDPPFATVPPGSGPRHFAFHPNGRTGYAINELTSTVTTFRHDPATGGLEALETVSTLPSDYKRSNSTAEVVVHPSGKFLYGSNRGHNSIAIFSIHEETGLLTPVGHQSTAGKTPRNFTVDPTGAYLLAANQESNSVVVFRVEPGTGQLTPTGHTAEVFTPVCLEVVPASAP
jgi:6-phosphogluconolactonase